MTSVANEDKVIDVDTLKFVDQQVLGDTHQEIFWKGWADIMYVDKKLKPRLLVISNFRLSVMKETVMGHSVRQSFLFLHLRSIKAGSRPNQLVLVFDEDPQAKEFGLTATASGEFLIEHPKVDLITQCVYFAASAVRYGRAPLQVEVPPAWLKGYRSPEPDEQDGMLASYLAECDRCGIPQRVQVLDYLMTCFQIEDSLLDVRAALSFLDGRECTKDVLALVSAVKYTRWFTSLVAVDFALKNDGCAALVTMFTVPTSVTKLVLVGVRVGRPAMTALAGVLSLRLQALEHIAISKTDLGDAGATALCEGLAQCGHVPATLALSAVGMGAKGCKAVAKLLSAPSWLRELSVLDLSDNDLGKAGTDALTSWLSQPALLLEQCVLARTGLELERLLAALRQHPTLISGALSLLDLSGNRLQRRACPELCSLLKHARSLTCVCLADCHMDARQVLDVLDAVLANEHQPGFSLDFSRNDLGSKGARDIQMLLQDRAARDPGPLMTQGVLQFLDLSDNNFGNEGLATIAKALKGTAVKGLKLDRNYKPPMFGKATEAGDALAELVLGTPSLQELSVAGDDGSYVMGKNLLPLLHAVCSHPALVFLDVQRNRVGDEGITVLAEALKHNAVLTGCSIDGSRMSLQGLQALVEGLRANKTMHNLQMPVNDLDRLLKSVATDRVSEVQALMHNIDIIMDSNEPQPSEDNDTVDPTLLLSGSSSVRAAAVSQGAPAVEVMDMPLDADVAMMRASTDKPRGSLLMRSPGSAPRGSVAVRTQRLSVAAGSYEDMLAELKPVKTHRKMLTRNLDHNVSSRQHQTLLADEFTALTIDESTEAPARTPSTSTSSSTLPTPSTSLQAQHVATIAAAAAAAARTDSSSGSVSPSTTPASMSTSIAAPAPTPAPACEDPPAADELPGEDEEEPEEEVMPPQPPKPAAKAPAPVKTSAPAAVKPSGGVSAPMAPPPGGSRKVNIHFSKNIMAGMQQQQ